MDQRVTAVRIHGRSRSGGFALIEVIVALFLLSMVASAVLAFFVRGMQATSHLQRNQAADGVAAQAMEKVHSISAVMVSGTSGIVRGRAMNNVKDVWNAADHTDTDGSTWVWDNTAATSVNAAVPLVADVASSGIHYTVTTLIGQCYRLAAASGGSPACTATDPGGAVPVYRVTVVVTWKPTSAGQCNGAAVCTYRMSSLVDPNPESNWNLTYSPVAYDDFISTVIDPSGTAPATAYDIVANDAIGSFITNPVAKKSDPAFGTAGVINSGTAMGMLTYTPPAGASGKTTLTYQLTDGAGRTSNVGTVNISVLPKADDLPSRTVNLGESVVIDLNSYVHGTWGPGPRIKFVGSPPAVAVGNVVTYTAPTSGTGTASFDYTVTDKDTLVSAPATVNITLTASPAPTAVDLPITVNASATSASTPLDMFAQPGMTGNSPANKIFAGVPVASPGWSNVGSLTGSGTSAIGYTPVVNTIGVYTFTYYVQNVAGVNSAPKTVTLTVKPVATGHALSVRKSSSWTSRQTSLDLSTIGVPNAGMTYAVGTPSPTPCGTASVVGSTVTFTAPTAAKTCTVSYTASKTVGSLTLSATANLVVTVTDS